MFSRLTKPILTSLMCATVLFASVSARAAEVSDGAGFFSAEAVTKANQTIHDLEAKSKFEIRIETYATVPQDKVDAVAKMDGKERDTFFSEWIHDRAKVTNSHGLVILVCKKPDQIRLWAGKPIEHAGFGPTQAKLIREAMISGFKARTYDKGLSDTLAQITTVYEHLHATRSSAVIPAGPANHKAAPAPHPVQTEHRPAAKPAGYSGLFAVMAIVIGAIVIISVISRLFGGGRRGYDQNAGPGYGPGPGGPGYGPGYGGAGGGGGFMKGLAGGLLGGMAGSWLYNQFSGSQAHGGDSMPGSSGSIDDNSSDAGGGFSGGTDYGGGGFDGGGDAGGNDFGGGDFGGGGD